MGIKKLFGAFTIASCALLCGCEGKSVYKNAEQYLGNRPRKELNEVVGDRSYMNEKAVIAQSKLDSIAYRDVFNTTEAAKDSSKVAEFNKIANQNRSDKVYKMLADKATVNEYNKISEDAWKKRWNFPSSLELEYIQHKNDSIAYRQFFEKHNLLNGKTLKLFNKISKQIRP